MAAVQVPSLASRLRGPLVTALVLLLGFFAGMGAWSARAPLTSAAVAPGHVGITSDRKTVQHLEGGIVREIRVTEGMEVEQGALLLRLDDTVARSTYDLLWGQFVDLLLVRARLEAEREGADDIALPEPLRPHADEPRVIRALAAQTDLLRSRRDAMAKRIDILNTKVEKLNEQIKGFEAQATAASRQIELIRKEEEAVRDMVARGLERNPRLYAIQRTAAELAGLLGEIAARQSEAQVLIGETRLEILDLEARTLNQITGELSDVASSIADMEPRLRAASDRLERTEIRAPVSGTVVGLTQHTVGGVVAPGAPILNLVPSGSAHLIEAQVSPAEIDVVRPGLRAEVRLTAFSARSTPTVPGEVVHVSADRLLDRATGSFYYAVHVEIDAAALAEIGHTVDPDDLYPGMPVEVMVVTGKRTVLNYLLKPLSDSLARAFRES